MLRYCASSISTGHDSSIGYKGISRVVNERKETTQEHGELQQGRMNSTYKVCITYPKPVVP